LSLQARVEIFEVGLRVSERHSVVELTAGHRDHRGAVRRRRDGLALQLVVVVRPVFGAPVVGVVDRAAAVEFRLKCNPGAGDWIDSAVVE